MKILVLLLICAGTNAFAVEAGITKIVGKLGMVQGDVLVNEKLVKSGADVREGATIEVKKGQATLLLGKGSVVHLAADSKMVVNQYGVSPAGAEDANLDLKFGRTRALILNQNNEKKDIKIKARAATMGVRGTEIFISAPADASKPVAFFTLEGQAVVNTGMNEPPKVVNQNEGVVATGKSEPSGGAGGSGNSSGTTSNTSGTTNKQAGGGNESASAKGTAPAPAAPAATLQAANMSTDQVRNEVKSAGMAPEPIKSMADMSAMSAGQSPGAPKNAQLPPSTAIGGGFLSDQFGLGGTFQMQFNPLADTVQQVNILPHFESAGP